MNEEKQSPLPSGARDPSRARLLDGVHGLMTDPDPPRLPAASLRGFVAEALLKVGLPPKDAAICAELIVRADLHGADGHGIFRLPQYVRRIRGGAVNVKQ